MIIIAPLIATLAFALLLQLVRVLARERTTSRAALIGLAWPFLCAAPAALVQAVKMGEDGFSKLLFLAVGWLIGVGGHSVTLIFEATVGERESTLADNFDYYLVLWAFQLALLWFLGALRFRLTGRLRDMWLLLMGVAIAVNALLNVDWPWWGT